MDQAFTWYLIEVGPEEAIVESPDTVDSSRGPVSLCLWLRFSSVSRQVYTLCIHQKGIMFSYKKGRNNLLVNISGYYLLGATVEWHPMQRKLLRA